MFMIGFLGLNLPYTDIYQVEEILIKIVTEI